MRLLIPRRPLLRVLRAAQGLLFTAAAALLVYSGFVIIDAWLFQKAERLQLAQLLVDRPAAAPLSPNVVTAGGLIGRIDIPRLGLSEMINEGIGRTTLRRSVGHIPGTAMPGERGNIGISGHRDTFFRPLKDIRGNDLITLTTLQGEFRYRVVSTQVVDPSGIAVLDPTHTETLTLVTCHPFYFVGPAPSRFIVRAERVADRL